MQAIKNLRSGPQAAENVKNRESYMFKESLQTSCKPILCMNGLLFQLFFTPDSLDRSPPKACCNASLVAAIWLATQDSKRTCCHTPAAPSSTSTPSRRHCKTKPNQTKRPKTKRKKNHRKEKKRESVYLWRNFLLSLDLSHGIQGREEQCLRLQSPAPHPPQTETKKTTGEWARFVEIATGKNERTSRGRLTVIRTDESGWTLSKKTSKNI